MDIRIYSLAYPVTALGPGQRVVLWVAGCSRGCAECISPEMQPLEAGRAVSVERLVEHVLRVYPALDGITISGGEPFDQAQALAAFLHVLRAQRPAWTTLVYSGYRIEEIRGDAVQSALLGAIDVLIDGPYRHDIPRVHPLTGSGNQRVHCVTPAGEAMRAAMDACRADGVNLGVGRGALDMIIGVTESATRAAVRETFGAETPCTCEGQGSKPCDT
jgi:anaerobic ribonucleoside-triphosphate reductase activating protein